MSTMTSGARVKVAGLFKAAYRWLRDDSDTPQFQSPPPAPVAPPPVSSGPKPPPSSQTPVKPKSGSADTLELPLQPVLDQLPAELKAKVRQQSVGSQAIHLPLAKVLPQLGQGSVKISFAELRRLAPGVFAPAMDCDQLMVALPLGEILPRINIARLSRRTDQKTVEVPDDVTSPFGANGKGLSVTSGPEKAPSTTAFVRGTRPGTAAPIKPLMPATAPTPANIPFQRGIAPAPSSAPPQPAKNVMPPTPSKVSSQQPPKPFVPSPAVPQRPTFPVSPLTGQLPPKPVVGNGKAASPPEAAPAPPRPTPLRTAPATATASTASSGETVPLVLMSVSSSWPQAVRLEIAQLDLVDAKVVVPVGMLEKGLRSGKVEFPWKLVRAWIRPEVSPSASAQDATPLDFPLSVVAPVFIARLQSASRTQRRVAVDETIPNLFFGFPQTDGSPALGNGTPVTAPVPVKSPDTNYFTREEAGTETVPAAATESPKTASAGTDFARRGVSPNELVTRAAALKGVAGALVALPDGLAVASQVPPNYNTDTLAAFLPQIFSKVSQCTNELRMGPLNNLNFTVGNVPWKIFRVNNVFFAAFGRAEETLPTGQLVALAAELERKPKTA